TVSASWLSSSRTVKVENRTRAVQPSLQTAVTDTERQVAADTAGIVQSSQTRLRLRESTRILTGPMTTTKSSMTSSSVRTGTSRLSTTGKTLLAPSRSSRLRHGLYDWYQCFFRIDN